jgi:hypothetical protein
MILQASYPPGKYDLFWLENITTCVDLNQHPASRELGSSALHRALNEVPSHPT